MRILPFLEQQNVYNLVNFSRGAFDQINIPPFSPNSGSLYTGVGQCSAYSTSIATLICPSSPVAGTINYYNDVYSGFGDGNGNPIPNPPTNIWGRTDYFATPGFHKSLLLNLGYSTAAAVALTNTDSGVICDLSTTNANGIVNTPIPHVRIASITDGTSNTVMIGEDAGRPVGYNHSRQVYSQYGAPVDGVINPTSGGGGAWADPFTFAHLDGSTADGIRGDGVCLINCTSNNEIYSFHPGGANMLFADGSVHFIKESINPLTIVALITRAGGEIISADQY